MSTFDDFMIDEKVKQDQEVVQLRRELTESRAKLAEAERELKAASDRSIDNLVEFGLMETRAEAAEAEAAALRERERWIPVEEKEPPKDGSEVLLKVKYRAGIPEGKLVGHWQRGGHCIQDHPPIEAGWYFWNGTMFDLASEPTHWKALSAAPERGKEEEQK